MKKFNPISTLFISSFFFLLLFVSCEKKVEKKPTIEKQEVSNEIDSDNLDTLTEKQPSNTIKKSYPNWYNRLDFEKVYGQKYDPPELDFTVDLTSASLEDLRIMRNQVFATKGYLFNNSIIRGYFNRFKWYQPIYWGDHEITLTDEENNFVNRCIREERKRIKNNFIDKNGVRLANIDNIVNKEQFEEIPENLWERLKTDNFARVANERSYFYYIYDNAQYEGIPKFITTDCYQYLLHVYFSKLLRDVEKKSLQPKLKEIISLLYENMKSDNLVVTEHLNDRPEIVEALKRNIILLAVAGNLLEENLTPCDIPEYSIIYEKAQKGIGLGCSQLGEPFYDFSQLQPRGTYTNDPEIAAYFKSLKWLLTAPIKIETAIGRAQAIMLAHHLSSQKELMQSFKAYSSTLNLFAGQGDDPSLLDLAEIIHDDYKRLSIPKLLDEKTATRIIIKLKQKKQARIIARNSMDPDQNRNALFIFPSSYTVDAEIHQRLTQPINNPNNNGHRLIPKGLDIFASFGNNEAENILLDEYKENKKWSAFSDTLNVLKKEMPSLLEESQTSLYGKRMDLFLSLNHEHKNAPGFMKTPAWDRQQLNSSLTGWTELAHEMVLYRKQPVMAEGGEGGGMPEPKIPGYVDPNLEYWEKCVDLMDYTEFCLKNIDYSVPSAHSRVTNIGKRLLAISKKELNGDNLTDGDFDWIHWIGSHLSYAEESIISCFKTEFDKMAIVTDVATYIDENGSTFFLEEAVGNVHELYAIVEINGLLYLTKGAVSTYYEFIEPGTTRLTDEMWREMLLQNEILQPEWIKSIYVDSPPLKSKHGYARMSQPISSKW